MRLFYDVMYRYGWAPWVGDARPELVQLVTNGTLRPGRAIDLGCGEGDNAIFLARHGFDVTAVDYSSQAIAKAKAKAEQVGARVNFVVDDLTHLSHVDGEFDVLVDYGTLDDLGDKGRDRYVRQVTPLARTGGKFLLWCFEWELGPWERLFTTILPFGKMALAPGEATNRFAADFEIEHVAGESGLTGWPRGWAAYLMTRR